jgi:hypothetical protein
MFKRLLPLLLLSMPLMVLGMEAAEAKIYIPCTGDRIVKVLDIPAMKRADGTSVDLGYLFPGCFSDGEWIGYTGKSDSYIRLDEASLKRLLAAAGLKAAPPTPSRWHYPETMWLEGLTVLALAGFGGWELFRGRTRS